MNEQPSSEQYFVDRQSGEHRHPLFAADFIYWNEPVYNASGNQVGYLAMRQPMNTPLPMTPVTPEQMESIVFLDEKSVNDE